MLVLGGQPFKPRGSATILMQEKHPTCADQEQFSFSDMQGQMGMLSPTAQALKKR